MTKSFYIISSAVTSLIVLFLIGQWIGRSYSLTKEQLARQLHESFCHATEQYETDKTKSLPALFREELDKRHLDKLAFRIDTISLDSPAAVQRENIRYFTDYNRLFNERHTFVFPVSETQGVQAYIKNPRAGSIGKLLYFFFGTTIALGILLICIRKQIKIIKQQDEIARIREDFSYAMIHDMKTPLSSILMGARILRSGKLDGKPEKKEKYFDILEEEAQHLLALTNKVLTISKLEHGQLLLEKSLIPIRPMLEELTQLFTAKTNKTVTFLLNIEAEDIFADEEYLKEAVSNLIDNAIKLLLVEDDANLSYIIQGGLEDMIGGYEVIIACNGKEGLEKYRQVKPDIIVADIEMPVMDGYEMVRRIRETDRELPILFSSARVSPKDVVKGYELGVDNYVKKPFLPEELDAHVRALLRMKQGNTEKVKNQTWTIGGYTLDPAQATLHHISGSSQLLTPRENGILELLFRKPGEIIRREIILDKFWNTEDDYFASRSLDVFVTKLRKLLSQDEKVSIKTIKGIGLMITAS